MAGRRTKLTDPVQKQIVKLLKAGVTVTDACAHVGISTSTFYDWLGRGEAGEAPFAEFSSAVSRAYNAAKVAAIETIRAAMSPYNQTSTTKKTFTETRINPKTGEEYTYRRVEESKTVTRLQGDFRAAIEYLKRRFPDEWRDQIRVEDWRSQAIADIRSGVITPEMFPELEAAFDRATAVQLFAEAGIEVALAE